MVLLIPSLFLLSGCEGGVFDELSRSLSPTPRRGRLTLPGIDNIPLARISQTNEQMRGLWAATDHYSSVNGSHEHGRLIRRTSCWSYIVKCNDPEETAARPFAYFQNYNRAGDYQEIDYADAGVASRFSVRECLVQARDRQYGNPTCVFVHPSRWLWLGGAIRRCARFPCRP